METKEEIILNVWKRKPRWAFSVREIVRETGITSIYNHLLLLMAKGILIRKWYKNHYSYILKDAWENPEKYKKDLQS